MYRLISVQSFLVITATIPGQRFCLLCIDREETCLRVRAAQKFSFDHSGNNKIAGVPGLSRNLLAAVNALHRSAEIEKSRSTFKLQPSFSPRIHQNYVRGEMKTI